MDPDQVVAGLVGMGFSLSDIANALEVVGTSIDSVSDYLLDDSRRKTAKASTSTACFTRRAGMSVMFCKILMIWMVKLFFGLTDRLYRVQFQFKRKFDLPIFHNTKDYMTYNSTCYQSPKATAKTLKIILRKHREF